LHRKKKINDKKVKRNQIRYIIKIVCCQVKIQLVPCHRKCTKSRIKVEVNHCLFTRIIGVAMSLSTTVQ